MFALVDANNFYVSCEKVFNPSLEGKPVIVLSNNDGCIISRSDEAKLLGLKMAEPAFYKKEFLEMNQVHVFSSNYALYGDMSHRMVQILRMFSPNIEIYSIDESFIDLLEYKTTNLHTLADSIKISLKQSLGIDVGIGIGASKSLAKIANKIAKRDKKYNGICILQSAREVDCALRNTPIDDVWGIGRQYYKFLEKHHIYTAFDFTKAPDNWIKQNLTVVGLRLKKELQGISCIPLETIIPAKKAIATTRGFGRIVTNVTHLKEAVSTYATRCSEKLRRQRTVANILTVFIHTDPFNKKEKYQYVSKTFHLPVPTNSQMELVKFAINGLEMIYQEGLRYKKAGVIVDGLEPDENIQFSIFSKTDIKKNISLSKATDIINNKYGRDKIKLAIQGDGKEWKLRQEMLSGKYTTQWRDIIEVKC